MLALEIFIFERATVDALTTSSVSTSEVATLKITGGTVSREQLFSMFQNTNTLNT